MAFERLPAPLAGLSSPARAALAVVGIAAGIGLIVLGAGAIGDDGPDIPDSVIMPSTGQP